jgi:Uma2 family endonuclease
MEIPHKPGLLYMDLDDFEEYLADKPEHEKWELIGGRVVKMMVGARWTHHRIVQNINLFLANRLREKGSPCRVYTETFWLKQRFLKLAVFPDVMVHCGPVDRDATSVEDPIALFEVVSPGSADRDRGEKAEVYRRLPSLQHYVLVERDRPLVHVLNRADERAWIDSEPIEGLGRSVPLPALEIYLPLAEIYRDVIDP